MIGYSVCGNSPKAVEVFNERAKYYPITCKVLNVLLNTCNYIEEAEQIWDDFTKYNISHDQNSYKIFIRANSKALQIDKAIKLCKEAIEQFGLKDFFITPIIRTYAKMNDLFEAALKDLQGAVQQT